MNVLLLLFYEFFKTGLFAIGGGLATIPFIYHIAEKYDWLDASLLPNMIAIAESTPGPIGINVATYAGYNSAGILGAVTATFALVLPSFIIILIISGMLKKFRDNIYVSNALVAVRPVSVGMISSVCISMIFSALVIGKAYAPSLEYFSQVNFISLALLAAFTFCIFKFKGHPIIYIVAGAAVGIVLGYTGIMK